MQLNFIRLSVLKLLLLSSLRWQTVHSIKEEFYRLYNNIFSENFYKKEIRPAESLNDALRVTMRFYLLSIVNVNEKQQMLETSARLVMEWDDDYLEWNSTEYGGIEELLVPQKKVYVPDIVLANSVAAQKQLGYDELPVRLLHDGTVKWEPTLLLFTDCDIDITYFPFETQLCKIDFETAVALSKEIDIDIDTGISAILLEDFTKNGQWDLIDTKAENLSNEDGKTKVRFTMVLKRRRTFYVLNIILPVFFLSLTASLVFALPADEGEKMGTGITVLLAFAVYLTIVSELVPNTSLQVSILGLYLTILLGLSALSVIICTFILRLHHRDDDIPIGPRTASVINFLRVVLCRKTNGDSQQSSNRVSPEPRTPISASRGVNVSIGSDLSINKPNKRGRHEKSNIEDPVLSAELNQESEEIMSWQLVAKTLDWLCFIIFTMSTFLVTLICLFYLHFGSAADAPSLSE